MPALATVVAGKNPALLVSSTVHDLRRTVATGLQRLGIRLEVVLPQSILPIPAGSRETSKSGARAIDQRWSTSRRRAC
jgi:hypothetical protein